MHLGSVPEECGTAEKSRAEPTLSRYIGKSKTVQGFVVLQQILLCGMGWFMKVENLCGILINLRSCVTQAICTNSQQYRVHEVVNWIKAISWDWLVLQQQYWEATKAAGALFRVIQIYSNTVQSWQGRPWQTIIISLAYQCFFFFCILGYYCFLLKKNHAQFLHSPNIFSRAKLFMSLCYQGYIGIVFRIFFLKCW